MTIRIDGYDTKYIDPVDKLRPDALLKENQHVNFSDLIWEIPNALKSDFCKHVIEKFQNDQSDEKGRGMVGSEKTTRLWVKDSIDLRISSLDYWAEEDKVFFNCLTDYSLMYWDVNQSQFSLDPYVANIFDTGYQIQETSPGGYYKWHHDFCVKNGNPRILTFIWYLNTIEEGGYTEFIDGTKIKPEEGKLIFFPATWNYLHRGYPPKKDTKYLTTGWFYSKED